MERRKVFLALALVSFCVLALNSLQSRLETPVSDLLDTTIIIVTNSTINQTVTWGYDFEDGDGNDNDNDNDGDGDNVIFLRPSQWGLAFPMCSEGTTQSPIDIPSSQSVYDETLSPLKWTFDPPPRGSDAPITTFTDDGIIEMDNYYAQIEFWSEKYELDSIEFHSKSAHHIDGVEAGLEMDIFYRNADSSRILATAFLFPRGDTPDGFIAAVIQHFLPWQVWNQTVSVDAPDQPFLQQFLEFVSATPGGAQYYRYYGSIMEPPCFPSVDWLVTVVRSTVDIQQINTFLAITNENHRPLQPVNGRPIFRNFDFKYKLDPSKF